MTKIVLTGLMSALTVVPQTVIGVRPPGAVPDAAQVQKPAPRVVAARPLLGYLTDDSNALRAVVGSGDSPMWGEPLALPESAIAFLPPRQEYALLASEAGLSVARLSRTALAPGAIIQNAMPRPERVAFSPSGEAAALFSSMEGRIEVVTHLNQRGTLAWSVPLANASELQRFAISDDGELLVAALANQPLIYSLRGESWRQLATSYWPEAWTFLPGSHDLVLCDRMQKSIVVLPQASHAPLVARVLGAGQVDANLLSSNRRGNELLAVSAGSPASWSINLLDGSVTPLATKHIIDSLTLLRDGFTFLVSIQDSPVLLKLDRGVAQTAAIQTSR